MEKLEIRKFFSIALNGTPIAPGCIYADAIIPEAPTLELIPGEPNKLISWLKKGGVYVAVHNIISGVSWKDLDDNGWVQGKIVSLDGKDYLCRLMEVGKKADQYCEYKKLLSFLDEDISKKGGLSWGKEQTDVDMAAARGGAGAHNWAVLPYNHRSGGCGWRPILEPLTWDLSDLVVGTDIEVRPVGGIITVRGKLLQITEYDLIVELYGFLRPDKSWGREISSGIFALALNQLGYVAQC